MDYADEHGHIEWDSIALVERIGEVCFVADIRSRNRAFDAEYIRQLSKETLHLQTSMQQRMAALQWIPLPYVAAYEALGWDARPLVAHRKHWAGMPGRLWRTVNISRAYESRNGWLNDNSRPSSSDLRIWRRKIAGRNNYEMPKRISAQDDLSTPIFFWDSALCSTSGFIPRTLGTLRRWVLQLSTSQIRFRKSSKGQRKPRLDGCFEVVTTLTAALQSAGK